MHFYVGLSICLWIYMHLFVDRTAFVCGSRHICALVFENPLPWHQSANAFFAFPPWRGGAYLRGLTAATLVALEAAVGDRQRAV